MSDSALVPTIYNNIQSETVLDVKGDEIQQPLRCTKAPSWSPAESRCCSSHAQIHWGYTISGNADRVPLQAHVTLHLRAFSWNS